MQVLPTVPGLPGAHVFVSQPRCRGRVGGAGDGRARPQLRRVQLPLLVLYHRRMRQTLHGAGQRPCERVGDPLVVYHLFVPRLTLYVICFFAGH